jgi:hypothetical protein
MSSRAIAWLKALSALSAEGLEPAEAGALCADLERMERSRTVRASPGFRLLRLACGGKVGGPVGWLLRYAMGRALATLTDPEAKPAFKLHAACTMLGERTGPALTLLAAAGAEPLAGGLLVRDDDGALTLAAGLAPWLVTGQVQAPGLQPLQPRDWLLQQPPIRATAARIACLVDAKQPSMAVLTSAESLLAAAMGAALGQARSRPVRCWSLDDARLSQAEPITALRWVGILEDFDPLVVILAEEDLEPRAEGALRPPPGQPPATAGAICWVAIPEPEPALPWLRDHPTSIDLEPLRASLDLPGRAQDAQETPRRASPRRFRRLFPGGYEGYLEAPAVSELSATDRRLQLEPLQRAVFPNHDPAAQPAEREHSDGEPEPHLSPALWQPSEQTLDHLVLPDQQHQALVNAARRAAASERCVVLLHGPPGSGKSMAARCLAGSAGLPVYQLEAHLGRDMWFGEQDRKLAEIFDALAKKPAVLVIDEVDGWIGRRQGSAATVGGSKIAESSAMLLHLERYQGVAVLTTNRIEALDPALQRRVDLDLRIGQPGTDERMALWGAALGDELALQGDELCLLASVPLTGGDIVATVREVRLKQGKLGVVALLAAARERARRASLWG